MRNNFNTLSSQEEASTSYKKKVAAATLAVTGLFSVGCSSEGSASGGGGLFSSGREVLAGEECSSRTDIHHIGTFSPVDRDPSDVWSQSRPAPGLILNREGIALKDGLGSESKGPVGTLVDMDTLTSEQNAQLDASYAQAVEGLVAQTDVSLEDFQYGSPVSMPRFQNGFIVAYGEDLTGELKPRSENEERYVDGEIDSSELQLCVFLEGDRVSRDQFIR